MDGTEPGVESEQQQSSGQGGARASAPGGSSTAAPGAVVGAGATRSAQPRTSSASSWAGGYAAVVSKGSTGAGGAVSAGGTSLAAAEAGASDTGGNARVTWSSAGTKAVSMPAAVGHSMTDTLLSASTNPGPMSDGVAPSNISPAPGWNGTVSPNMVTASWGASSPSGAYAVPAGRGGNPPNHGSPSGRGTAPNAGGGARSGSAPYYGRNAYTGVPNRPPYGPRSISASAGDVGSDGRYTSNVPYGSGGVSGSAPRPGGGGAGAINVSPVFMGANNMTGYMPDMQQTGGYAMYIPPQYYAPPRNPMAGGEYMPYGMPYNPAATAAAFYRQQYQQQARTPINHGMAFGGERGPSPPGGSTASPGAEISGYAPLATQALSESAQPNALTPNTGGQASISNASPPSYPAESSADSSGSMSNLAIAGDRAAHPASSTEREAPGTNVFTIGTMSMERRPDRLSIPPAPPRRERKLLKIVDPETGQELNLGSVQDELASAKGAAQSVSPKGPTGGAASTPNVSSTTERLSSANSELVPPKPTGSIVSRETASTNKATVVAPSMDQAQDAPNPWDAAQPNAAPMAFSDRERSESASQTPELPQKTTPLAPTVALDRSESNLTANASAETMDSGAAQLETKLGQSGSLPLTTTDEASIPASCVVVVADQNGYVTVEPDDGKDARVEQVSKSVFVDAELHAVTQSLEQAQIHHEPDRGRIHIPDEIEMAQALPTKETSAATRTDVADGSSAVPEEPVEPLDGDESGSPGGTPADSEPEDDLQEMDDSGQGPDYETDTASLDTDQETEHPGIMVFGPGERRVYPRDWLLCMRAVCISCPTEIEQCEIRTGANFEGVQQRRSGGGGGGGRSGGGRHGASAAGGRTGKGDGIDLANARSRAPPLTSSGAEHERRGGRSGRSGRGAGDRRGPSSAAAAEEALALLPRAENAWRPRAVAESEVERKVRMVRSILNKLTLEKFDPLYQQLLSINIDNLEVLRGVVKEIFEKALLEPNFGAMYAELCARLAVDLEKTIEGNEAFVEDGKPQTFKRILLRYCQREFEGTSAPVIPEGTTTEEANEIATKAKLRMLGNMVFIGHLYRNKLLSDKVIHASCFATLLKLSDQPQPDEDAIECMCKLMTTVGEKLDNSNPKSRELMREYFRKFVELSQRPDLPARFRFMLQDLIDLRNNRWVHRRAEGGARTIREIHEQVRREQVQQQQLKRRPSGSLLSGSSGGGGGPSARRLGSAAANGPPAPGATTTSAGTVAHTQASSSPRLVAPIMSGDARRERSSSTLQPGWERVQRAVPETREAARALDLGPVRLRPHGGRRSPAPSTASTPSLGTPRNSFAALQDERTALSPEPLGGTDDLDLEHSTRFETSTAAAEELVSRPIRSANSNHWEPEQIERRAKTIYDEWFALRDATEARLALAEVPSASRTALVASLLQRSLDLSGEQRDHLLQLLTETVDAKLEPLDAKDDQDEEDSFKHDDVAKDSISTKDASDVSARPLEVRHLRRATSSVLAELEDLVIDHPRAVSFLGHWLAHCLVSTTASHSDALEQRPTGSDVSLWGRPVTFEEVAAALHQIVMVPAASWCANGSDLALRLVVATLDALRMRSSQFATDHLEAFVRVLALPFTEWVAGADTTSALSAETQVRAAFAQVGLEQVWSAVATETEAASEMVESSPSH